MSETNSIRDFFDQLSKILLRCWILGFVLLLIWFGVYRIAGETVHSVHGSLFGLAWHEMQLIFYCGMGLLKLSVLVLFFLPWLAIRLALRNKAA